MEDIVEFMSHAVSNGAHTLYFVAPDAGDGDAFVDALGSAYEITSVGAAAIESLNGIDRIVVEIEISANSWATIDNNGLQNVSGRLLRV